MIRAKCLGASQYNPDREDWVLIGGYKLSNVHPETECLQQIHCPIHRQSVHHMLEWPQGFGEPDEQMVNDAGDIKVKNQVMVRVCSHGNWHVDPDSTVMHKWRVFECRCFCCAPPKPQQKLGGT